MREKQTALGISHSMLKLCACAEQRQHCRWGRAMQAHRIRCRMSKRLAGSDLQAQCLSNSSGLAGMMKPDGCEPSNHLLRMMHLLGWA